MQSITKYIKTNETLRDLDFLTVYVTIIELIKDDKADFTDVRIPEQQSK